MPAITLSGITKYYGKLLAINDVSLEIKQGEVFGLLGPNGSGKTTLISMMTTLLRPTKGSIHILKYDTQKQGNKVRENIGVVFQDFMLDDDLTVYDNLKIHALLYPYDKKTREKIIASVIQTVDLQEAKNQKAATLSGGMKKRLEIARGLLWNQKILFLDEPTLGLDPIAKRQVWKYIKEINKKMGVTIVLATNNMEEAETLCTRVAIINKGNIIKTDTIKKLLQSFKTKKSLEDVFIKLTKKGKP